MCLPVAIMGLWKKIKKFPLIHLWLITMFIVSGLIINLLQALALIAWPINRNLYRRLITKLSYWYFAELTFAGDWWANVDITFYGNAEDFKKIGKESAIVVPNHRGDIDWLIGYLIAERGGYLGAAKTFMKSNIKYIPTIGWAWWFSDYFFLKRNWDSDQEHINKVLSSLKEYPIPFMLGIFAEGTRITPAKLKASQEYALSKGIKPLKHHLLPRTKGFAATVHSLKDKVPALYDIEFICPDPDNATLKCLLQGKTIETHLCLRRIEMKDVPTESIEATTEWCKNLYNEKDDVMEFYFNNGKFAAPVVDFPKRPWNLIIVIIWNILLALPVLFILKYAITSGSYIILGSLFSCLIVGFFLIKILFRLTDSKKGSSFGLENNHHKKGLQAKKTE